ncbi:MAG: nuclear transport factor 2 family protein, partial [Ornithinimicrobium sp.]
NNSGHTPLDGPTEPDAAHETRASKRVVDRFVTQALIPGDPARLVDFVAPDCVQHSPGMSDGRAAWQQHAQRTGLRYVEVHLLIGQGDFVATLAEAESGGTSLAVIDLFRVSDGLIAEHWDVAEEITPASTWVNSGKFSRHAPDAASA